ncbi:MAG: hypothetical protein HC802_19485 [Caldilineaceae bacterium]|nr:hypothetical protein [Caldilineaceae bacterium]
MLAGGALSGSASRHPVASSSVNPIASAPEYEQDVASAQAYSWLVEEGSVSSLVEAALRFAISKPQISTALIGVSTLEQLDQAIDSVERGALSADLLTRIGIVRNRTYAP